MDTVIEKLILLIRETIRPLPNGEITEDSELIADLGLDSLDQAELIVAIEKTFGIEFSDAELVRQYNVSEMVATINRKMK